MSPWSISASATSLRIGQALEPAPVAGLEEGVAERRPSRARFSVMANRPDGSAPVGREREVVPRPAVALDLDARLGEDRARRRRLSRRHGDRRRPLGAGPDVALVRLARDDVQAPAVEPPVLDADRALAVAEGEPLALPAGERARSVSIANSPRADPRRSAPPHPADALAEGVGSARLEGERLGPTPPALTRRLRNRAGRCQVRSPTPPGGQRVLGVLEGQRRSGRRPGLRTTVSVIRTTSAIQRPTGTAQGTSRIGSQFWRCRPSTSRPEVSSETS